MKKILIILILPLLLFSCGKDSEENESSERSDRIKTGTGRNINGGENTFSGRTREGKNTGTDVSLNANDFLIETKSIPEFDEASYIQKIGKIIPNQNIDIKSQVTGKIALINVKEGQEVYKLELLARVEDSYSKYYLDLEKANIDLEKQVINKETQLLSLDKKIADTKLTLEDDRKNYENAKIIYREDLIKAGIDLKNSKISGVDSEAFLELEQAKLAYENILESNQQQINSYTENIKKEYNNLYLSVIDVIQFSDELLGITPENKDENDDFENFLGAKDKISLDESKTKLRNLINYKDKLKFLNTENIKEETMIDFMDSYSDGYSLITELLESLETTLNNSITSEGSLSDSDIDGYISKVNSFQGGNQGDFSSFNSTRNSILTFLNTYKNSELSALKNTELQEKKLVDSSELGEVIYNKQLVTIDNSLSSAESKHKQAGLSYENALRNKDVSIKSLNNAIASATNSKNKAAAEYNKLNILSPINGIISSIDIDKMEDVSSGTKLFSVISDDNTQIEVSLSSDEIKEVSLGDSVKVDYDGEEFYGEVYSKSKIANQNLDYDVLIVLENKIDLVGGSTIVNFITQTASLSIPFDLIDITGENIGTINTFKDGKLETIEIELGKISGNKVEILSELPDGVQIITTDLKNYNELNQLLKILNK